MAAESSEDRAVDTLIEGLQATLDKLKSAQHKDVADEDAEEASEPKNLKQAGDRAYKLMKADRGKGSSDDAKA